MTTASVCNDRICTNNMQFSETGNVMSITKCTGTWLSRFLCVSTLVISLEAAIWWYFWTWHLQLLDTEIRTRFFFFLHKSIHPNPCKLIPQAQTWWELRRGSWRPRQRSTKTESFSNSECKTCKTWSHICIKAAKSHKPPCLLFHACTACMPSPQHDTWGSHLDWIFMAIKYLCRSLSLAHSLFFAALQQQITMTHFLLTNYSKQFQFRQRAIQLVASHKLAGKRRGVLQRVWNRLAQRASESSALRVGSDRLGMRHHAFQKKNVCFADVKQPRSSAVLLIWFWHFLLAECVKMSVFSVKDASRKTDAQGKTQDVLTVDDSWSFEIIAWTS